MIKKIANLLLIILVFLQGVYCQTQSNVQNQKYLFSYNHFTSQGKYIDGLKDGNWKDISDSGVIYVDGYYFHGIPISEWKINYPNGELRKAILYDSLGNVIKWTRYDLGIKKLVEIIPDTLISFSSMKFITNFEENCFDLESIDYSQGSDGNGFFAYAASNVENIADSLVNSDFQGKCLQFYESGNVSKQYNYKKGAITDVRRFYYKNGKVNIEDVYIADKLKRTIKYDESGNVIKIIEK